jgi:hypothetical protein
MGGRKREADGISRSLAAPPRRMDIIASRLGHLVLTACARQRGRIRRNNLFVRSAAI